MLNEVSYLARPREKIGVRGRNFFSSGKDVNEK